MAKSQMLVFSRKNSLPRRREKGFFVGGGLLGSFLGVFVVFPAPLQMLDVHLLSLEARCFVFLDGGVLGFLDLASGDRVLIRKRQKTKL